MKNRAHKRGARHKPKRIKKSEHQHYWPYIPVLLVIAIFAVSLLQPAARFGVLAYATEMSHSQLLESTNQERTARGIGALAINATLNEAAQAKANDMINKDYWSHNTPDGQEPWVFFDAAGYAYLKAGENLAYGFSSSGSTVTGWMNSPSHRDNLLDVAFTEVGFGYANSKNFNGSGPQTVVVAMYGRPQTLSQNASQPTEPAPSQSAEVNNTQPKEEEEDSKPVTLVSENNDTPSAQSVPVNSDTQLDSEPASQPITRVESLTGLNPGLTFAIGIVLGCVSMFLLIKHAVRIRHLVKDSTDFVLHHPILDSALLGIILVGVVLLQTSGVIR